MRVVFFGTPEFAVASLEAFMAGGTEVAAVVTTPDRPAGRGQKVLFSAVKQCALQHHIPLLQPEWLKDEAFLESLRSLRAEAFVVVAFRMLPEAVWAMPPQGTFNLHASLLPRYRGAAPINWAIINGESVTGVTTFMLNHHIDEGAILLQRSVELASNETAGSLHDKLASVGQHLVVETLDGIEKGILTPRPQQGIACPAPKIYKETCKINFQATAREVERFVRGLAPYPAATLSLCTPAGEIIPFKIFRCKVSDTQSTACGAVECDGKSTLKIAASDYFVEILELQMAGKRKNSVEEFLRGKDLTGCKLV